jgi:hypothetical protein
MIKYRIQVTVDAERLPELVSILYKAPLAFDPELKVYPATAASAAPKAPPLPQAEPKPKRRPPATQREMGKRGAVVEEALKTGPKRWTELKKAIADAGLSESTLNSLISKWQTEGRIQRGPHGLWELVEQKGHSHVEAHA